MISARALQLLAATALIAIAASSSGLAQRNQGQQNALQGFSQNRDQPVKIQAVSLEVREKDKMATFSGDVHVVNGDTELRCKSLRVFYDDEAASASTTNMKAADPGPNGSKQIKRIVARGNVVVVQKEQQATGDTAIFNMRENTVVLAGNVVITRGADVLTGQKLMVDLTNGVSKMESSSGRSGGMVQGVFQTTRPAEKK